MKKLLLLISLLALCFIWYEARLSSRSDNTELTFINIAKGETTAELAKSLEKDKLISSSLAFKIYFYIHRSQLIQAGDYEIQPKTKTREIIKAFVAGKIAGREVSVLIREGLSSKEINTYLKENKFLSDDSFLKAAKQYEGYLFPDTYRMFKDFTADELIAKMRANFEKKITPDLRTAMEKSGQTGDDIIIMASLLEKEVRTEADMKIVSGIFWDRIKINQALQSCASLAYILGVNKVQYSYEDTQIDSSYNTYRHPGLPPGPISNPGLKAIKAAIYPTKTDYNYFLSRPDTGETIFSETLDEHNEAKAKYLK